MARYRFEIDIAAPRERVFSMWVDLDRAPEWVEGLARYTDVSGPPDEAGTTYVARFGSWSSSTLTVLEAERPRYIRVALGSWLLRGENIANFEEVERGTRLIQEFDVRGIIPRIAGRIFATGSYRGSFRGELETFKQICEREEIK
ncbi:MAG TPA: SRPBCC family protein [Candidatus Limnocylindrales bacterium]|nr:SRPBCC family protein [Candidatus Limnocylindrales bacterium]